MLGPTADSIDRYVTTGPFQVGRGGVPWSASLPYSGAGQWPASTEEGIWLSDKTVPGENRPGISYSRRNRLRETAFVGKLAARLCFSCVRRPRPRRSDPNEVRNESYPEDLVGDMESSGAVDRFLICGLSRTQSPMPGCVHPGGTCWLPKHRSTWRPCPLTPADPRAPCC